MRNKTKQDFWTIAFLVLFLECVVLIKGDMKAFAILGLGFQAACLVFMREDVK